MCIRDRYEILYKSTVLKSRHGKGKCLLQDSIFGFYGDQTSNLMSFLRRFVRVYHHTHVPVVDDDVASMMCIPSYYSEVNAMYLFRRKQ